MTDEEEELEVSNQAVCVCFRRPIGAFHAKN